MGDVHGCVDELRAMLAQVGYDKHRDTLVLVGDLVNKGPGSGEVLQLAQECKALCVRGNHDDELLKAYYRVGRYAEGLEKYKHDALYQVTPQDIHWLQEQPLSITFPWIDVLVVHAGLIPDVPLEDQDFMDLTEGRNLRRTHGASQASQWSMLQEQSEGSVAWATEWKGPMHVVFGHDARRRVQEHPYATGLDSACCYGDRLTALVADVDNFSNRRLFSVAAYHAYAPKSDEKEASEVGAILGVYDAKGALI